LLNSNHSDGSIASEFFTGDSVTNFETLILRTMMKRTELERMSTDDLWLLHVEVSQLLQQRIQQEKLRLEERLKRLQTSLVARVESGRRPYPPVLPKYFNPDQPSETWAGRGKRPRWLVAQLKSGKPIDDLRVGGAAKK
jgi:DNA-binding protein H-NS